MTRCTWLVMRGLLQQKELRDGGTRPIVKHSLPPCKVCTGSCIEPSNLALPHVIGQREEAVQKGPP